MKNTILLLGVAVSICTANAQAQPPGPHGERHGPRHNPILDAFDADGDTEVSFDEIAQAVAMLQEQDTNGDKKLSGEELRGIFAPPPRDRGPREVSRRDAGPRERGPGEGGPRGRRGPADGNRGDSGAMAERLMEFDKNKDGKLASDEVPKRMQRMIKKADANDDGFVDKDELASLSAKTKGDRATEDQYGDRRGRGPGGPGGRRGPGGAGGPGGPPNPEMMVEHAFEFDSDEDGKLSRTEMEAFAMEIAKHRRGPGG